MAGIKRALRRRLLWTLVAGLLAAVTLTGCGDDLSCPGSDLAVDVDGASGVEACVVPTDETGWSHLRVRNRSGAPITVWGPTTLVPWPVQPDQTADISLVDPQPGEAIPFKQNLQAGVTSAVLDKLAGQSQAAGWRSCANQPDQYCLAGLAAALLPKKVPVGHATVPVQQIGTLAIDLWKNESLVRSIWDQASGQKGTLTLRQA
jgi:hypothetical protein